MATLESLAKWIPFSQYFGGESQQKLLFVPDADKPDVDHEISEPALFRFLLNEETLKNFDEAEVEIPEMLAVLKTIDKESKIIEFETHQSSIDIMKDFKGAFHVFIVFKSTSEKVGDYWWSLEKGMDFITLQRSSNKNGVKDKLYGESRTKVEPIEEGLIGKGTIQDLFALLWAQQIIPEKYHILNSNCQSFVTFISQQITEKGYKYQGFFKYSPAPECGRDKKMLDLIVILRGSSDWHPLFTLIQMGNIDLFDKIVASGKYDINAFIYNGLTPLDSAILFSKTEMVKHLLKHPLNADPTRGEGRMNALHWAAMSTMKTEIFDLLLAHEKINVDDVHGDGMTALHAAAYLSNVIAVKHLIDKGANPNIIDKEGISPLHVAVCNATDMKIIDLLLENIKQGDIMSLYNNNEKLFSLVSHNKHEKEEEIVERLLKKGIIKPRSTNRRLLERGADPTVRNKKSYTPFYLFNKDPGIVNSLLESGKVDINETIGEHRVTALHLAIITSNLTDAHFLLSKGANPNAADVEGRTPLQWAAWFAKDMTIIELLLNHEDTNVNCLDNAGLNALQYAEYNEHGLTEEIANLLREKGAVETNWLLKKKPYQESQEYHLTLLRDYYSSNRKPDEIENVLSDATVPIEDKIVKISDEYLLSAIRDSNVESLRLLLKNGADTKTWGETGANDALHFASCFAKTTDVIDAILETGKFDINGLDNNGWTPLHYAMGGTNFEIKIRHLIGKGADPNIADKEGNTPLHYVTAKEIENINLMLEKVDINHRDKEGMTASHSGIIFKRVEIVRCLMENGADPTISNKESYTPFHLAAMFLTDTDVLNLMLENEKQIDIDESDKRGSTALHLAIMKSNVTSVRFLLARGANPNVVDKCGHTPLHVAVALAKNMDIVKLLLNQNDANVNYLDNNGFDALRFTKYNKYGLTESREIGDFDINCREENGRTPLHFAMIPINVETARYLLEKGADPTIGDNEGTTPFHLAAALSRETDILGLFLANNKQFDIDHRDKFETTALHMAVKQSNTASAEYLLSKGANPNAAVQHGYTTLHIAAKYAKDMDMVKLLLNHKGTNVNYLDNKGRNALHYAMDNMHGHGKVIANLLREKMATTSEGDNYEPKNIAALVPSLTEEDSDIETIRLLIEDGQDVSAMTWGENGANALHLAAANEETTDLIDAFLETGKFDIDGVDNNGRTPLHYAIKRPNPVTINVRRLIKMGADPSIADKNGVTPLHMAAKNENAESMDLIEILLNTEAVDVNCVDKQGRTPLACARDNKHGLSERIANRLKENGAVRVEEEICQDNLLDECTSGGEATGNSLVNDEDENESETENPKKAPTFKIVVDSSGEKIRIQIKEGTKLGKGNWGEHVMNALRSALRKAKATEIIDISLDTESRDPHVTTPPECTSDDDNENMVKKVLTEAIAHSDAEKVRNLIEMGADISKVTWRGLNALHAASVCAKTTEILDVILASGEIDINAGRNEDGETALHFALRANKMTTARYLLEKGADTTKRNNAGNTPFHEAATFSRETDILDFIMANNKKFDIDHRNQSGLTALHMAIKVSNTATAEYLLSKGANPNAADRNGRTPLHVAAYYAKDMEIVKLLLNRKNVNVNYLDNSGHSALFYTMSNEHGLGEAIAKLLRGKMAAKTKGINHEPENMAAPVPTGRIKQDSDMETIRFLIENGQDISAKTWGENGAKALHVAAANEETTELIDIILETGQCNINGVDSDRRTPLHYAIKRPDPVTINARRLIKMGADPNSADKNGVTPLHMAARNAESMDLIELLLNSEALDVNCVDKQGLTPLAYARGNKHGLGERIIARLRESGANEGGSPSIEFEKNAILGKGDFGTVFRGEWNNKRVAVKRIELAKCENNKEGEALQKLGHPNVVKLYHVESDSDFRYYALKLCQASLDHKFFDALNPKKYRGPMPSEEEVCLQLAKGLAHIHKNRLIHRDLKPHSVLIWVDSGQEKVVMKWADFGFSKPVNERGRSHSISGSNRGTDNWYAPEILSIKIQEEKENEKDETAAHQRGTVKSDVFSEGLVFGYYLLDGDHPFGSGYDIQQNILKNEPVNLAKIKKHPMHAIIMEMLKGNPDERISSADFVLRINQEEYKEDSISVRETQPTPSPSDHGKDANIRVSETVDASKRTGEPMQSDVGLLLNTKQRQNSPVPASSPTQIETDCSQDVNNADKADQESITVWHGDHCPNCVALCSINEANFAGLQHHFKYCSTYCVYYQLMKDLEKRVQSNGNIKDKYETLSPSIFYSKQAHHLCQLLAENPQEFTSAGSESSKEAAKQLFKKAAKLSEELLGPAETATFDCDRYEEYMRLLLEIAQIIKADAELIDDIEMYLKPFDRNRIATSSSPCNKWDETFFDLKHSPEDEDFGSDLKRIMEPESGEKSFLIPTEYKAKCHGITGRETLFDCPNVLIKNNQDH